MSRIGRMARRLFPFLFWPLHRYPDDVDRTTPNEGLDLHLSQGKHSLRLQRYWWAAKAIEDEARRFPDRVLTVIDLGCERGWLKRFVKPMPNLKWIGLDGNLSHPSLAASRYDQTIQASFAQPLPLASESADIVASLHVFEHLPNLELATGEVARVLKPQGLFLVGTPVAMGPLASIRTKMLQAEQRAGTGRPWGHLHKFSPGTWAGLCQKAGLAIEFLTGSHLIRARGLPLESQAWWIRLNQVWGSLFPSLGQEVYLAARKNAADAQPGWLRRLWVRADWMVPVAATVAGIGLLVGVDSRPLHPLADEIAQHQDGDDVFRWCALAQLNDAEAEGNVTSLPRTESLRDIFEAYAQKGLDLHIVVRAQDAARYRQAAGMPLYVADEWRERDQRFVVLSEETQHIGLDQWVMREQGITPNAEPRTDPHGHRGIQDRPAQLGTPL